MIALYQAIKNAFDEKHILNRVRSSVKYAAWQLCKNCVRKIKKEMQEFPMAGFLLFLFTED